MSRADDVLARIDAELAANRADRDTHPADATIPALVTVGKLPPAALDWRPTRNTQQEGTA